MCVSSTPLQPTVCVCVCVFGQRDSTSASGGGKTLENVKGMGKRRIGAEGSRQDLTVTHETQGLLTHTPIINTIIINT